MPELYTQIVREDNERSRKSDFSRLYILDEYLEDDMIWEMRKNFFQECIKKDIRMLEYYKALNRERSAR